MSARDTERDLNRNASLTSARPKRQIAPDTTCPVKLGAPRSRFSAPMSMEMFAQQGGSFTMFAEQGNLVKVRDLEIPYPDR